MKRFFFLIMGLFFHKTLFGYGFVTHIGHGKMIWESFKDTLEKKLNVALNNDVYKQSFLLGCIAPDLYHDDEEVHNTLHERPRALALIKSAWDACENSPSQENLMKLCFSCGYLTHILQDRYLDILIRPWLCEYACVGNPSLPAISALSNKMLDNIGWITDFYYCKAYPNTEVASDMQITFDTAEILGKFLADNIGINIIEDDEEEKQEVSKRLCVAPIVVDIFDRLREVTPIDKEKITAGDITNWGFNETFVSLFPDITLLMITRNYFFVPMVVMKLAPTLKQILGAYNHFKEKEYCELYFHNLDEDLKRFLLSFTAGVIKRYSEGVLEYYFGDNPRKHILTISVDFPAEEWGIILMEVGYWLTFIGVVSQNALLSFIGLAFAGVGTALRLLGSIHYSCKIWADYTLPGIVCTTKTKEVIEPIIPAFGYETVTYFEVDTVEIPLGVFENIVILSFLKPRTNFEKYFKNNPEFHKFGGNDLLNPYSNLFKGFWENTLPINANTQKEFILRCLSDAINYCETGNISNKWLNENYWSENQKIYDIAIKKSMLKILKGSFRIDHKVLTIPTFYESNICTLEVYSPYWTLPDEEGTLKVKIMGDKPYSSWREDSVVKDTSIAMNLSSISMKSLIENNQGKRIKIPVSFEIDTQYYGYHIAVCWNSDKLFFTTDLEPVRTKAIERVFFRGRYYTREHMDTLYTTYDDVVHSFRNIDLNRGRKLPLGSAAYPHAIESAGSKDGNYIKFLAAGNVINFEDKPGIWVVVIRNGTPVDTERFHTYKNPPGGIDPIEEAKCLYNYLKSLSTGDTVLIGICGDGVGGLKSEDPDARNIRKKLGNLLSSDCLMPIAEGEIRIKLNDSWSYLGVRTNSGFKKIYEQRRHWGEGVAIALPTTPPDYEPPEIVIIEPEPNFATNKDTVKIKFKGVDRSGVKCCSLWVITPDTDTIFICGKDTNMIEVSFPFYKMKIETIETDGDYEPLATDFIIDTIYLPLPEGRYIILAKLVDKVRVKNSEKYDWFFYRDTTPPVVEVYQPDSTLWSWKAHPALNIIFKPSDNLENMLFVPKSVWFEVYDSLRDTVVHDTIKFCYFESIRRYGYVDTLSGGKYIVKVFVKDKAGNVSSDTGYFIVDTKPPQIEITQTFTPLIFTSKDTAIIMKYLTDEWTEMEVTFTDYVSGYTEKRYYTGEKEDTNIIYWGKNWFGEYLPDGLYKAKIIARDKAGNEAIVPEPLGGETLRVDRTAPEIVDLYVLNFFLTLR